MMEPAASSLNAWPYSAACVGGRGWRLGEAG